MRENKKNTIIETAVELLQIQGYSSTGINEIIEKSGSPRGSLYHYFKGGKDEIVTEALLFYGNEISSMLWTLSENSHSLSEFIQSVFTVFMENLKTSDFTKACPVAATALESGKENVPIQTVLGNIYGSWNKIVCDKIISSNCSTTQERACQTADALISLLQGSIIAAKIKRDESPMKNALDAAMLISERMQG